MTEQSSFIMVSPSYAVSLAKRVKVKILKRRMESLKKRAIHNLTSPKFVFFGKKQTYTQHELNQEMARIWRSDEISDLLAYWHYGAQELFDLANAVIKSASMAKYDVMFLSVLDASALQDFVGENND